jgi:hypothetical protein
MLLTMRARLGKGYGKRVASGLLAYMVLLPITALGWTQGVDFETHVHDHEFHRVQVDSDGCDLKVRLVFNAPEAGYKSESPARNFYRFKARLKLDEGRSVETRVFSNSAPGARAYTYVASTAADGCWAKAERKLRAIDVEGCRGAGCTPEPFK